MALGKGVLGTRGDDVPYLTLHRGLGVVFDMCTHLENIVSRQEGEVAPQVDQSAMNENCGKCGHSLLEEQ